MPYCRRFGMNISAYISFIEEIRIETAPRQVWKYELNRKIDKVIDHYVKYSDNLFCNPCKRNHSTENALRNCLWYHRDLTLDNFVDHELIQVKL